MYLYYKGFSDYALQSYEIVKEYLDTTEVIKPHLKGVSVGHGEYICDKVQVTNIIYYDKHVVILSGDENKSINLGYALRNLSGYLKVLTK